MIERVNDALANIPIKHPRMHCSCSPPTAFPKQWPTAAATKHSSARRADWSPRARAATIGSSSIRVAAARRNSPGSSPTCSIFFAKGDTRQPLGRRHHRANRFHFRPPGSALRPRHRSQGAVRRVGHPHGASRHRRHPPAPIRMIRELVEERLTDTPNRLALGALGPKEDVCPDDCCVYTPSAARPHR